ncbi:hypothetical protein EDB89DRAFT_2239466 [Lactarius sanguifluus]|nr:hypothetical protein EDB89DRAFT_2239466 [Lactarius sanguifluus]
MSDEKSLPEGRDQGRDNKYEDSRGFAQRPHGTQGTIDKVFIVRNENSLQQPGYPRTPNFATHPRHWHIDVPLLTTPYPNRTRTSIAATRFARHAVVDIHCARALRPHAHSTYMRALPPSPCLPSRADPPPPTRVASSTREVGDNDDSDGTSWPAAEADDIVQVGACEALAHIRGDGISIPIFKRDKRRPGAVYFTQKKASCGKAGSPRRWETTCASAAARRVNVNSKASAISLLVLFPPPEGNEYVLPGMQRYYLAAAGAAVGRTKKNADFTTRSATGHAQHRKVLATLSN